MISEQMNCSGKDDVVQSSLRLDDGKPFLLLHRSIICPAFQRATEESQMVVRLLCHWVVYRFIGALEEDWTPVGITGVRKEADIVSILRVGQTNKVYNDVLQLLERAALLRSTLLCHIDAC